MEELRAKAKELLESGQVKVVIGYEAGSLPFKSTPCFAETPEDADRLIWNPSCVNNLAVYLPKVTKLGKAAVVVKPCDARSVTELLKENQIKREDVVLISVPCPGVIDPDSVKNPSEVQAVAWNGDGIGVSTASGEAVVSREDIMAAKCLSCDLKGPEFADVKLGESPARKPIGEGRTDLEEYERLSPAERRAFWAAHFERCIRCYACRNACPGCYCAECFIDKPGQLWALKSTDPASNWFFHVTRAMHTAGRCIGCGECERACPMGIPLSLLGKKLEAEIGEMFDYEAGEDPEAQPVLGQYEMDDPDPCPEE